MRFTLIICLISIGYVSAQYQGDYENNVNPYPRSQASSAYDSGENYSPPPTRSVQSYPPRSSAPSYSKPKAALTPKVAKLTPEEEEAAIAAEEEKKPSELELLLANSKFSCASHKDGYYADNSLNCQVFHYCVQGAKHSWMCPKGTVFHQVHLNCVPQDQDICQQSEKYHIVNEYLHKPIEQSLGPNQTVRYHQRYYPDEFLGDPLAPPSSGNSVQQYPPSRPSNSYNSYEDETPISYRQPARSNKPANKPKASSYNSGGNYPVSLISSPQPSRKPAAPVYDNYDEGSYRSAPVYSQPSNSAVRSQPSGYQASNKPAYRQNNYQPYSAAASSPSYKPSSVKPNYQSNYASAPQPRPSAGYESNNNNNNARPYNDFSGVTYEEDESY